MSNTFVGTRWYKCDLHLHTPASLCFKDRDTITPEQWVQEAIDKGLHCVAVTDHNTAEWVDKIKLAAQNTPLTVFPGVELTCSDSKVHLLILFDINCSTQNVEDFLIKAEIDRTHFGLQTAHANLNLEDIANLANDEGALVIPAHIDEFAGLCDVAPKIVNDFYALSLINSV
jgi:predicted metal-dependent phosphoesterase TrpH